jgi:probable F420-dependent oxidoreductase
MGQRRFRFGVVGESIRDREQLLREARRAEELGYSTLLLRDHFVREPFGDQLAPMVALTAAASVTSTLRVGTLVLDNDYRHPAVLAKEAATLDVLSGGRFELGIGAGWLRQEYEQAGIPFDPPGVRVDRLEESIQVIKRLLSGSPTKFQGSHYSLDGLESFPPPVQRPRPPILIGAGSRRMLGLAGREADVVNILPKALSDGTISEELSERSPETIERKIGWVREAAGKRFDQIELSAFTTVVIGPDAAALADRLAAERGWDGQGPRLLEMPSILLGPVERIADQLNERRERLGLSYYVVSDELLETAAPVVERLAGR